MMKNESNMRRASAYGFAIAGMALATGVAVAVLGTRPAGGSAGAPELAGSFLTHAVAQQTCTDDVVRLIHGYRYSVGDPGQADVTGIRCLIWGELRDGDKAIQTWNVGRKYACGPAGSFLVRLNDLEGPTFVVVVEFASDVTGIRDEISFSPDGWRGATVSRPPAALARGLELGREYELLRATGPAGQSLSVKAKFVHAPED